MAMANPIFSVHEGDTVYQPLLKDFVDHLPSRMEQLSIALGQRDFVRVRRLAHQIKGSSASYGFPSLAKAASGIESYAMRRAAMRAISTRDADTLAGAIQNLMALGQRVTTLG